MDAAGSFFPTDLGAMPMQTDGVGSLPNDGPTSPMQNKANGFSENIGGAFMGVSTAP
jgi:hypothetical protein